MSRISVRRKSADPSAGALGGRAVCSQKESLAGVDLLARKKEVKEQILKEALATFTS